jgi:hypothetical protein
MDAWDSSLLSASNNSWFFEIARVFVCLDHVASLLIWQADESNAVVTFLVRRGDRESATFGNLWRSNV